jgi:hypothetical protein
MTTLSLIKAILRARKLDNNFNQRKHQQLTIPTISAKKSLQLKRRVVADYLSSII